MMAILVALIDRLAPLFRLAGVDVPQLRAIVRVKLLMDNRRSYTTLGRYGKKSGERNNTFLWVLLFYTLFGGLFAVATLSFVEPDTLFLPLTLEFSYVMALCAMTLISDFSSIILDSSDNQIILPRPVSSRTLWVARVVHISVYLFSIALAASLGGILVLGIRFGVGIGLLCLLMSLLSVMLTVFLTNLLYLGLMQFIGEERLREVINYTQIVMAIAFYGGYQLLPQLMPKLGSNTAVMAHQPWHLLVPPMWMAGAIEAVMLRWFDQTHLLMLGLSVLMPFGGLWFMNRFLTGSFSNKLSSLDQDSRPAASPAVDPTTPSLVNRLAGWATSAPLERAAFLFVWRITSRDRKFKLKTYPQLGFGLAYTVIMSYNYSKLGSSSHFYLFALYFAGLDGMVAQYQLSASDNFRASWLYGSAPIRQPGFVLLGAVKAVVVKLLTPFYILLSVYILYRYGLERSSDVVLAYLNILNMVLASALLSQRHMPFSVAVDAVNQSNTGRGLILMVVLSAIGGIHYALSLIPYGVWAGIPLAALTLWLLANRYRQSRWDQITMV